MIIEHKRSATRKPQTAAPATVHCDLKPVADPRVDGGKRYARTVPLPRSPWNGVLDPVTDCVDVSFATEIINKTWLTVGYVGIGKVRLLLPPIPDGAIIEYYTDQMMEEYRTELIDIFNATGVWCRDGISVKWFLYHWDYHHVYGNNINAAFRAFARDNDAHLGLSRVRSIRKAKEPPAESSHETPIAFLRGWKAICRAVGQTIKSSRAVMRLNTLHNGPITRMNGQLPLVEKEKLLSWWNKTMLALKAKMERGSEPEEQPTSPGPNLKETTWGRDGGLEGDRDMTQGGHLKRHRKDMGSKRPKK